VCHTLITVPVLPYRTKTERDYGTYGRISKTTVLVGRRLTKQGTIPIDHIGANGVELCEVEINYQISVTFYQLTSLERGQVNSL
jgi:hypothetical protein